MAQQKTGIFYLQNAAGNTGSVFPKELCSALGERVERRFALLFLISFLLIGSTVFILSFRKVSDVASEQDMLKIQERYASIVLNQPKPKAVVPEKVNKVATSTKEEAKPEEKPKEKKVDREKETYTQREERKTENTVSRQAARAQVSQQVASSGIFAAITAVAPGSGRNGGSGAGGVSDLLSAGGQGIGDLSNVTVTKGSFAAKNADIGSIQARHGGVTSGVDIGHGDVGQTSVNHIASSGSVRISSPPPVLSGSSQALSARTPSSTQPVINLEKNRLKRVFETWLKKDPTLAGQIKIKFTIMPSGEVTNVSIISSSTKNSEFDENIIRYIKRWAFDPVEGGGPVEVIVPIAFEGQGSD